jgi:hypothetical protein
LRAHAAVLGVVAGDRQADRHRRMVVPAQQQHRAALGQRHRQAGGPGDAVRMDDHRRDVVERHAADLVIAFVDEQKAAVCR